MATVEEAKKQLEQQRQQLAQRKREIQAQQLKGLTAAQKRQQTQQSLTQRKVAGRSLEARKQQELTRLKPVEVELEKFQKEIEDVEKRNREIAARNAEIARQQRDYKIVKKFVDKNIPIPKGALTSAQRKILNQLRAGKEVQVGRIEAAKELRGKGLTFLDVKKQQQVQMEELGTTQVKGVTQPSLVTLGKTLTPSKKEEKPFDVREPFGPIGFVRTQIEKGFEKVGKLLSKRMQRVAERGAGKPLGIEDRAATIGFVEEKGKILEKIPKRQPINIFGQAITETGKILALPVLAVERGTQFITKPKETVRQVFGIPGEKRKIQFRTEVTPSGEKVSVPIKPLSIKERVGFIAETGIGGLALKQTMVAGKRFVLEPKKTEVALRERITPEFVEKRQPISVEGRPTTISQFEIRGETKPPTVKIITTRAREFLGLQPKKVVVSPSKKFTIQTITPAVGDVPFFAGLRREGSRIIKVSRIAGESIPITIQEFQKLPKLDKFLLQKIAEQRTGVPVSMENVPKVLKKEGLFQTSSIELKKIADVEKFRKLAVDVRTPKPGKTISRAIGVSEVTPFLETDAIKVFRVVTFFKDVTKPGARAIGRTPKLKGTIIETKEPIRIGEEPSVQIQKPADIQKTPLKTTFVQQIQATKAGGLLPKPTPIKKTPKVSLTGIIKPVKASPITGIQRMLGGEGLTETQLIRSQDKQFISQKVTGVVKPKEKGVVLELQPPKQEIVQLVTPIPTQTPIVSPKVKFTQVQVTPQPQLQVSKLMQIEKLEQLPTTIPKPIERSRPSKRSTPLKPLPPVPKPIAEPLRETQTIKKLKEMKQGLDIEVGMKLGKKKTIAKNLPPFKALKMAQEYVDRNIEASFRLKKSGKIPRGKDIKPPRRINQKFRPSKRNPLYLVEKRKYRLDSRLEKSQIKRSKKLKNRLLR